MIRKSIQIKLGDVKIGKGAPISIQSMTNTDTKDIKKTINQIKSLEKAGCEIIRVAVKDTDSAKAISKIKKAISIPLEADIHFDYRLALLAVENNVDGIRLNPGNIYKPTQVKEVIEICKKRKVPIRIGVNSGSLKDHKAKSQSDSMVKSVLNYLKLFKKEKFNDIMISLKASDVSTTIDAYRKMAKYCNYPFHLGVTATGSGIDAIVKSSIGIGTLLAEGIGDTIRVSLTADPREEVLLAREILQALGIRRFHHEVISCPTCGRCQVNLENIVKQVKNKLYAKRYPLSAKQWLTIAIMGCEVNGPGEAKDADIGIAFGKKSGILFKKAKVIKKIKSEDTIKQLLKNI